MEERKHMRRSMSPDKSRKSHESPQSRKSRKSNRSPRSRRSSMSDRSPRRSESPQKRLDLVKDVEIEESVVDKQLRELNEERRKHLLKKQQISRRIESKTRELDFIKGLDSEDILYMLHKKDVYAAKLIQKWWRIRKMRKIFTKETHERVQMIKAAMKLQQAWRRRQRRKFLTNLKRTKPKRISKFYDPLNEEKLKEYEDKVKSRVRTFTLAELGEKTPDQLERDFIAKYREFYDNYIDNELIRRKAHWLCEEIDSMTPFFSEDGKVSNIKVWGYDGNMPELYLEARKANEKKLETALSGKMFLHEDDDLDIEGDRILREIRAYKGEMVANHFY